jgi:hypothetical protein
VSGPQEYVSTTMLTGSGTLGTVGKVPVAFRPDPDLIYTAEQVSYVTQD